MPNITETISLLDELRGLLELYNKKREKGLHITGEEEDVIKVMERSVNIIEALRQAALDGERYRKEAEAGRLLLKDLRHIPPFHEYIDALAFTDASGAWDCFVNASEAQIIKILTTYRQAVEQKEV